ncbi:MAG: NADH-dependent [FeFe] hydrogenase, group A6 [Firmicutes bacterium]|nr:NADH-dependent [FeFe] hydrogenase, group A6 [Bacillota bacterium]
MKNITLTINNTPVTVAEGATILEAAKAAGFNIPTLCYLKDVCQDSSCRVCVVEVKGARSLVTACSAVATDGMEVTTNTQKIRASRKTTVELILSNHDKKCLSCVRSGNCELQNLSKEFNCDETAYEGAMLKFEVEDNNPYIVRDNNKCVLCRRCIGACHEIQSVGVIGASSRGFNTYVGCAFDKPLGETPCVACGQCITVCPTGALSEKDDTQKVLEYIADPDLTVIVGTAPSVRVTLGEEFGGQIGADSEGKMVAALKMLGFSKVFDIDMTADLTIMEEGAELLERLKDTTAKLPMITSCSPGWVRFIEFNYPALLGHLSSCKSPQQMFGAVMKTYYAEKTKTDPSKIRVVSIMPCTAKKYERMRANQAASGFADIDAVLTTRELARLIKSAGIDFKAIKSAPFDSPVGEGSTAGLIFGASGGVMEAALRTLSETVSGKPLANVDFKAVRGTKGIKEAAVKLGETEVKVCVVSGLANARIIMDEIKAGKSNYHMIEVMACPGGCVNGGGQPIQSANVRNQTDLRIERAKTIYNKDKRANLRKSHENPVIKALYKDYFGKPGSHKAHDILHTTYIKRKKFT